MLHQCLDHTLTFSGCCRVYLNGTKTCIQAFPQDIDILTTFVDDLNKEASASRIEAIIDPASIAGPNFHSMQQSYVDTSKAYTAIMVTDVVWAFISTCFVMVCARRSLLHFVGTIPGALLALGSAGVATYCIVFQMGAYELSEN